jgi:hypothetical protein
MISQESGARKTMVLKCLLAREALVFYPNQQFGQGREPADSKALIDCCATNAAPATNAVAVRCLR